MRQLPLALESPGRVPSVEVGAHGAKGELLYQNSWLTALAVAAAQVAVVVQMGRTRWQSEPEQFQVHTNHGSDLTHHSGHGQQTLSLVFYLLHLLASGAHVVRALGARLSQRCRTQESRRELGNALRTLVNALLGESWRHLLPVYLEEADASPERALSPTLLTRGAPRPSHSAP